MDAEKFAKAFAAFEGALEQAKEVLRVSFFSFTRRGRENGGEGSDFSLFYKAKRKA